MSEPIIFTDIKLESGWLMIRPEKQDLGKAMAIVRKHKDRLYDLEIKEHRNKRSLDANAYAWVLIHKIAAVMGIKPVEVYREAIRGVPDNYTPLCVMEQNVEQFKQFWSTHGLGWFCDDLGASKVPGCRNMAAYHGSSTYDTKQMARLIDNIVQDCKALEIETMAPDKLSLLVEDWDA